jgi:drug/metabolite transporter (DMT)-like permease
MTRTSVLLLSGASLAAAAGQLLFRVGAQDKTSLSEFINAPILLGLLLYGLGTLLWIYTLSKEKLVVVYAFTVLTFALVYIGSMFWLGESLGARGVCGIALVMGGLYLLAA